MELHSMHKPFHHIHLGEERHQMLNLNQRLESYLGRVKFLEEENVQLHREIHALRRSNQGTTSHRKGLEKELRQARLEVDAAWREKDRTELEVQILAEEHQALGLQRQRVAEAMVEAKVKLDESRKEMEEEQRAQIWLREKVNQLEKEIQLLTHTHQDDMAHLETTLTHARPAMPPTITRMSNQMPNLLQLGQEYTQRASRAWQEASEAYQGQVDRLEESLNQTRGHLNQLGQEKSESQLKLQALQKEISSAQQVRLHLEKSTAQQRDRHSLEIQQLQEVLQGLEVERDELGQHIDRLVLDNRSLLQLKMTLGLEVATYRALLDNESLRGDMSSVNQPRNIYITDAFSSPRGVKDNYQSQLSTSHKTTLSSVHSVKGRSKPAVTTTPSIWTRRPAALSETPVNSWKTGENQINEDTTKTTKSTTWSTPYPKVLQNGAVEHFRPQDVHEEVTYAEPLSPPNEQEPLVESLVPSSHKETTAEGREGTEDGGILDSGCPVEERVVESAVSYQVESKLSSEQPFNNEVRQHQHTTENLTPYHILMTEESFGLSDESDKDVRLEVPAEKEDMSEPHAPVDAWVEKELMTMGEEAEHAQEETSDSETEAVLEPTPGSTTGSPASEHGPDESMFNQLSEVSQDEQMSNDDAEPISQQTGGSMVRTHEKEFEDKLYPDGEEMDTWDSVIERKVDLRKDDGMKRDETETQHAEPEDDISAREPEHEEKEIREEVASIVQHDNNMASSPLDTNINDDGQHALLDQEHAQLPGRGEENDEEEDSQNVSVSWRTELESDSYAQDNTLADTRPLIRYKSDETDANTQASHMDESESSEGEEDKKVGETGTGILSESKSKRSGTMEDLCEEVEGEVLDEEYDLGYTHTEDRDVSIGVAKSEHVTLENDKESEDVEMIAKAIEGHSDEGTEQFTKKVEPMVLLDVDDNEDLESVDRLVEQELESLSTFTYSAHFAQQQASECEVEQNLQAKSVKELTQQEEAVATSGEDILSGAEPEVAVLHKLTSSTTEYDQPHEHPYFSVASVAMPHTEEEVKQKEQGIKDAAEKKEEEDEHNLSMVTHADMTEDHSVCSGLNSRPESQINNSDMEESNISEDESPNASLYSQPISTVHVTANEETQLDVVKEAVSVEVSSAALEYTMEEVADSQAFPEGPETTEWEILENPVEDLESRGQNEDDQICDTASQSAQSCFHDEGSIHQGAVIQKEESPEISPDSLPAEEDIFVVQDSTDPLNTNGKDKGLHGFFSSGVSNDPWASSLETGATYLPDDPYNEAAEQSNQNLGFDDNLVWGNLENSNVANGNSKMDTDSSNTLVGNREGEQKPSEVKQSLHRYANEGESVHSEDSEDEGESWSSGEE